MTTHTPDELNAMTPDERKAALASEFGSSFHVSASERVAWMIWTRAVDGPTDILGHASAFILDCGKGPMLVTAAHVYQGYLTHMAAHGSLDLQICNTTVADWRKYLIDCGDIENGGPDIATFRLPEKAVSAIGKIPIVAPNANFGPTPNVGENVLFGGFPAEARDIVAVDAIDFYFHSGSTPVTSTTPRQITCRFNRDFWVDSHGGLGLPRPGYPLGGISGGPMLVPDFIQGAWGWRLTGVISEAPEGKPADQVLFESVVADRAQFILADGRLAKSL